MKAAHLERGEDAERLALGAARTRGLALVKRNYRCKVGEIDLICEDGDVLVFIEVRYRRNTDYGLAAETVGHRKQMKIIRAAKQFLQRYPAWAVRPMRFDVVAIQGSGQTELEWIEDAFQL
ncbi:MAG TPA: YraN family protein [Gammaproteobacteria bacterium]|nr:YraN family protein [Gammaproteobacteria bacterium]